jgi:hypothetical protein
MELVYENGKTKVWRVHLMEGDPIPSFALGEDIKCVVWSNTQMGHPWRNQVAARLVADRVRFMLAGGVAGTLWDDAVDWADIGRFPDFETPDERFVMTTWHDDQSFANVLWQANFTATFDDLWFDQLLVVWLGPLEPEWDRIAEHTRRILEEEWIPEC